MADGYNIKIGVDSRSGEQGVKSFTTSVNGALKALRDFDSKAGSAFKALDKFAKFNGSGLNRALDQVAGSIEKLNKIKVNTKMIANLQSLSKALNGIKFTGAKSLAGLPAALSGLDKVKINARLVTDLNSLKGALKGFGSPAAGLKNWPKMLNGFSGISINSGLAKSLDGLKSALKGFTSPSANLKNWPKALSGFASVTINPTLAKSLEGLKTALKGFTGPPKSLSNLPRMLAGLTSVTIAPTLAKNLAALKAAMAGFSGPSKSAMNLPVFLRQLANLKITPTLAANLATLKAAAAGFTGPSAAAGRNLASLIAAMNTANVAQVQKVAAALQRLSGLSINVGRTLGQAGRGGAQGMNGLHTSVNGVAGAMHNLTAGSEGVDRALDVAKAAFGGFSMIEFAKGIYETGTAFQALERTLHSVASSDTEVQSHMQFLQDLTSRMPISLEAAAESYRKFAVSARLAGQSAKTTQDVFANFSTGFSAMGLSTESQKYAFIALEQIFSKGQVQMEELKSQLGDHLPGAVQILAQSMNVPVDKLMKMIEAGKVGSDAIIKMGENVKQRFGAAAAAAVNSTQGQFIALQNSWTMFKKTIFDSGFNTALGALAKSLNDVLKSDQAAEFAKKIGEAFGRAFEAVSVFAQVLSTNKDVVIDFFKAFVAFKAIESASTALKLFTSPVILLAAAFAILKDGSTEAKVALLALGSLAVIRGLAGLATGVGVLGSEVFVLTGGLIAAAAAADQLFNNGDITDAIITKVKTVFSGLQDSMASMGQNMGGGVASIFAQATSAAEQFKAARDSVGQSNLDWSDQEQKNAQQELEMQAQKAKALSQEEQKLWDKLNPIGAANAQYESQLKLLDQIAVKEGMSPAQKNAFKQVLEAQKDPKIDPIGNSAREMSEKLATMKQLTAEEKAAGEAAKWQNDMMKDGVAALPEQWAKAKAAVEQYTLGIAKMNGETGNGLERFSAKVGNFMDDINKTVASGIEDFSSSLADALTGGGTDLASVGRTILKGFAKNAIDGIIKDAAGAMGMDGAKNGAAQAQDGLNKLGAMGKVIQTQMLQVYADNVTLSGKLDDVIGTPLRGAIDPTADPKQTANAISDTPLRGSLDAAGKTPAPVVNDPNGAKSVIIPQNTRGVHAAIDAPTTNAGALDFKEQQDALEAHRLGQPVPADMQKYLTPNAQSADYFKTSELGGENRGMTESVLQTRLMKDFQLKDYQAAGVVGNLAHESAGFTANNEIGKGGGFGLAQWTGDRRTAFEKYAKDNKLDPQLFGTQYGYLKEELTNTPEKKSIDALRGTKNSDEATKSFMDTFERPGKPLLESRNKYARETMNQPDFSSTAGIDQPMPAMPTGQQGGSNIRDDFGLNWNGKKMPGAPQGLIFHHTGGRGTPDDVMNTLNQRGLGSEYIMDRDGSIIHTVPDGAQTSHIRPATNGSGLNNSNALGIEMIAKDNNDLTEAQKMAGVKFIGDMQAKYPTIGNNIYGHGEVNPGHKEPTEGMGVVNLYRQQERQRAALGNGPTGSIPQVDPNAANSVNQLNTALQQTGSAANSAANPMQQVNTALNSTGTAAQTSAMGVQQASAAATQVGPAFQTAGQQVAAAGQAAAAGASAAGSGGEGLNKLLSAGSMIPGAGAITGPLAYLFGKGNATQGAPGIMGSIMSLFGGGGLFGGMFKEGGISTEPVQMAKLPHYSEGTANTGGMPAVLHPNEAVIPLSRGRKVPVEMTGTNDNNSGSQETLDKGRPVMVINLNGVTNADSFKRSKGQLTAAMASAQQRAQLRDG